MLHKCFFLRMAFQNMEAVLQVTYSGSFTPGRFFFSAFLHYIPQLPGLDWLESADFESGGRERGGAVQCSCTEQPVRSFCFYFNNILLIGLQKQAANMKH